MMIFLWLCVATSAFVPNGDRVVSYYTAAMENYFDSMLDDAPRAPAPPQKTLMQKAAPKKARLLRA